MAVSINDRVRENLEVPFIALTRSSYHEQIDSKRLFLFRNGVKGQCYSFNL